MPQHTLRQLIRIYGVGFTGFLSLVVTASVVAAAIFPGFVKRELDLSLGEFPKLVLLLALVGAAMSVTLLLCTWGVGFVFRKRCR